ncbi:MULTISPECIES: triose-phosphate isomerase [Hoeflea]|uniref:Triosephosphate isomerase n=1 Tax=Hoeflea alexandrii TaxID=288436 RepID=A0ABT1CRX2_9HYPH|nr:MULTISPECIES: triose-phosphate isomerase [Hoeflea]MCO6408361.1 triose-phosphate isomerase [Hoeflea alexandrii]VVT13911.1 Triosephosphate isomerase [Hoeflea sp. EC-HK425]
MTPDIRPLVAGNWKMNGTRENLSELKAIAEGLGADLADAIDALICPPATLLYVATALADGTPLSIGAQDCHDRKSGAYTGDISAEMIADCLAGFVLVGHSERRTLHGESNETVRAKAEAAKAAGLTRVICIGETEAERKAGETLAVLGQQLAGSVPDGAIAADTVIAYEPVWAIGTGLTPTVGDVAEAHAFIRAEMEKRFAGEGALMRLLYGGSVKPDNAAELLAVPHVDGALIGGASLKASDFLAICKACRGLLG